MTQIELTEKLPTVQKQQDFYVKLRNRITSYLDTRAGSASKFAPYLLFAPDLFHLLTKTLLDNRIDGKSKVLIGSGILYFIAPFDFISEGLIGPGGFIDDIIVTTFIVNMLLNKYSATILEEHWVGDQNLLDVLRKISKISDRILSKLPSRSLLGRFMKNSK